MGWRSFYSVPHVMPSIFWDRLNIITPMQGRDVTQQAQTPTKCRKRKNNYYNLVNKGSLCHLRYSKCHL